MLSIFSHRFEVSRFGERPVLDENYQPFQKTQQESACYSQQYDQLSFEALIENAVLEVKRLRLSLPFIDIINRSTNASSLDAFTYDSQSSVEGRAAYHASELLLCILNTAVNRDLRLRELAIDELFLREVMEVNFIPPDFKLQDRSNIYEKRIRNEIHDQMQRCIFAEKPDQNSRMLLWKIRHAFEQAVAIFDAVENLRVDSRVIGYFQRISQIEKNNLMDDSNWLANESYKQTVQLLKDYCLEKYNEPDYLADSFPERYKTLDLAYFFPEFISPLRYSKNEFDASRAIDRQVARGVTLSLLSNNIIENVPNLDLEVVILALTEVQQSVSNFILRKALLKTGLKVAGFVLGTARRIAAI